MLRSRGLVWEAGGLESAASLLGRSRVWMDTRPNGAVDGVSFGVWRLDSGRLDWGGRWVAVCAYFQANSQDRTVEGILMYPVLTLWS